MIRFLSMTRMTVVLAATLGLGTSAIHAKPVVNITRPIHIVSEVNIRPEPSTARPPLARMPAGSEPIYTCYEDGENVGGTTKWFKVTWDGITGYYSSIADDVPLSLQNDIPGNYGIPYCGTGVDINQGSGSSDSVTAPQVQYDGQAAANYALAHAQDIRPNLFSDCTWLTSQALWYGGLPQSDIWNGSGFHGHLPPIPGTSTATVAGELVGYLQEHFSVTPVPLGKGSFEGNQVSIARPGDIIAYLWHGPPRGVRLEDSTVFDHLAVVVDIAPGQYPEVSEWGTQAGWEPYQKRGWTWSALHHQWLQQEFPNVAAVLIHFNR